MLTQLLPLAPGMTVALVGAGGKTTTMFRLAAELTAQGQRVITTTTTHIFPPTPEQTAALIVEADHTRLMAQALAALESHHHITLATSATPEGKLRGLPPGWVDNLHSLWTDIGAILVEADGAKGRLLKAPADHEPVIPPGADLVLLLASALALGQPLSDSIVHRPERVAAVTGLNPGEIITPQALATLATSDHGLLKGVPFGASAVLVLTQVDSASKAAIAETAQLALASGRLAGVCGSSLEWAETLAWST